MKASLYINILAVGTVFASLLRDRDACIADNCLRAVRASASTARGTSDCSNYLTTTVTLAGAPTLPTPTVTVTVYSIYGTPLTTPSPTPANTPGTIPAYASWCSGSVRYSSACSCIGITSSLTTASTVTPPTVTHTSTIAACNPANDYGHKYNSGAYGPPAGTTDQWTNFPGNSASCCAACFRKSGCMIYQHFQGTCYLTSYTGGSVANPGNAVCKAGLATWNFVLGNALGKGPCAQ